MSAPDPRDGRPGAAIFGVAGYDLTPAERAFFTAADPLGFILFARNIRAPDQVRTLIADLRRAVGRDDAPVLIDQEGGRVARLRPPHWRDAPPAARFAELAAIDPAAAVEATRLNYRLIAAELADLGITVDCAPVADVPVAGAHDVIGDRALGRDPAQVARLARAAAEGLLAGGVLPVIKHIPGHGRAHADSHAELPKVDAPRAALEASDFAPFRALADLPWAMTAHVLYTALDAAMPATISKRVIDEIVRGHIGFGGVLVCDDLSMEALSGDLPSRARAALAAGCDVVLHCNGALDEMQAIAAAIPPLSDAAQARVAKGEALRRQSHARFERRDAANRLESLLAKSRVANRR